MDYSFSALAAFQSCPKSFEYKYRQKQPEAFSTIERHMGSGIHETLRWAYEKKAAGMEPGLSEFQDEFRRHWNTPELVAARVVKQNKTSADYFTSGLALLNSFFQRILISDSSLTLHLEFHFDLQLNEQTRYRGIIDRMCRLADGTLRLTDFKTGKVTHPLDDLQLPSYALYAFAQHPEESRLEICYEDLLEEKTVIGRLNRPESDQIRGRLLHAIAAIEQTGEFTTRPSRLCLWCGYNPLCPNPHPEARSSSPMIIDDASRHTITLDQPHSDPEPLRQTIFHEPPRRTNSQDPPEVAECCPECGGILRRRKGKFGSFLGCANFPDCRYTLDLKETGGQAKADRPAEEICPECGGTLRERRGKYGPFWGCGNFPRCRFTRKKSPP